MEKRKNNYQYKTIYPFRSFHVEEIVNVLHTQDNWAFILDKNDTISRCPINKLAPVTAPEVPVFGLIELNSLLTKENIDPRMEILLKKEVQKELEALNENKSIMGNKSSIDAEKIERHVLKTLIFIQRAMQRFPKIKEIQTISMNLLGEIAQGYRVNESLMELKIPFDVQKTMQCFSQHRDLQLTGLKCLRRMIVPSDIEMFLIPLEIYSDIQNAMRLMIVPSDIEMFLIPLEIYSDIQNAMRFFENDKEIQDICCLVISYFAENKICAAKMMDVNLQDDVHFMIKKYPKDKVIHQELITTLVSFGKHFPCDERLVGLKPPVFIQKFMKIFPVDFQTQRFCLMTLADLFNLELYDKTILQLKIYLTIKRLMQSFGRDGILLSLALKCLGMLSTNQNYHGPFVNSGIHNQIQKIMKSFRNAEVIQKECCYIISNLATYKTIAFKIMDIDLYVDINFAMKKFPRQQSVQLWSMNALQKFYCHPVSCNSGIHYDIKNAMKSFADDAVIQYACCNLMESLAVDELCSKKMSDIKLQIEIRLAKKNFPNFTDLQTTGASMLRNLGIMT
eukprot:Awhi_evm1s9303